MSGNYRRDIDGLRAIAVLSVVAVHAYPTSLTGGFTGVDVFFVISGYLICGLILKELREGEFSFLQFYARRARRIFPALILVLAFAGVVGFLTFLPDELSQLGFHIAASAGFVMNMALAREVGYFDASAELKPLLHIWSLGVEEQFYIVWPIVAVAIWRRRSIAFSASIMAGIAVASFGACLYLGSRGYYLPQARFWQLMIGGLLAHAEQVKVYLGGQRSAEVRSVLGMVMILVAVLYIDPTDVYPGTLALLPTFGAALLISAGPYAFLNRNVLGNRTMVWIGLISYPLYLWHWPLLAFARVQQLGIPPVAIVAVSVALAWLTYRLVEIPIRFKVKRYRRFATLSLPTLLVLLGSGGFAAYGSSGWSGRIPENLDAIANFKYDYSEPFKLGTCFVDMTKSDSSFAPECGPEGKPHPLLMLWGDSHSAHLRAGIQVLADRHGYSVAQLSASGCLPNVPDAIANVCDPVNAKTFERIKAAKPDVLILAGYWKNISYSAFSRTLETLKTIGVRTIVVGPVPIWNQKLPRVLYNYAVKYGGLVPERTAFERDTSVEPIDAKMRELAERHGVQYVSPIAAMCNAEGCRVTGDKPSDLYYFDKEHLTRDGSIYLANRIGQQLRLDGVVARH